MRLALTLALLAVSGCGMSRPSDAPSPPPAHARMDAALRLHLASVAPDVPVDVLVGLGTHREADARRDLTAVGLDVRTVAGRVAVARGTRAALEQAAALPWVEQIELSQERPPLTP